MDRRAQAFAIQTRSVAFVVLDEMQRTLQRVLSDQFMTGVATYAWQLCSNNGDGWLYLKRSRKPILEKLLVEVKVEQRTQTTVN